jgi:acyl carrier protein
VASGDPTRAGLTMPTLEERVYKVVSEVLGLPLASVGLKTSYETVPHWDSVNMINLLMAFEAEFEIRMDTTDAARLKSVPEILEVVRKRGAQ